MIQRHLQLRTGCCRYQLAAYSNARYTYCYYFTVPTLPQVGPIAFRHDYFRITRRLLQLFQISPPSRLTEVQLGLSISDIR